MIPARGRGCRSCASSATAPTRWRTNSAATRSAMPTRPAGCTSRPPPTACRGAPHPVLGTLIQTAGGMQLLHTRGWPGHRVAGPNGTLIAAGQRVVTGADGATTVVRRSPARGVHQHQQRRGGVASGLGTGDHRSDRQLQHRARASTAATTARAWFRPRPATRS